MNFERSSGLLRRLPAFAVLAVAAWLLARIALVAWDMARYEAPSPVAFRAADSTGNAVARAPGSSLFGAPPQHGNVAGTPGVLRDGNFRLTGVVASGNRRIAHAIIETGGVSEAYFPGDTLAAGISLLDVRPNEVLLQRGSEVLRLPLSDLNPGTGRGPAPAFGGALPEGLSIDLSEPPRMTLSQLINMEPVMDSEGRMEGYRITPRARRAWFESQGLVSGDLIVAINGVSFGPQDLAQARQELNSSNDLILSILRDGEQLEVTIESANFGLLAM